MKLLRWPLTASFVCMLGGFGVTGISALIVDVPPGVPSMYDYWSGTIGDLLLLPLIVFGLTRAIGLLSGRHGVVPSWWSVAAGMAGAAAGAISQLAWLVDPEPRVNWMLIEPHVFSPIGWYHAAFVIVVAGYVTGATVELLLRARRLRRHTVPPRDRLISVLGGNGAAVVITAGVLFAVTVVADSYVSRATSSSAATILALVGAFVAAALLALLLVGKDSQLLLGPILVAAFTAASVIGIVQAPSSVTVVLAVAATGAALVGLSLGVDLYGGGSNVSPGVWLVLPLSLCAVPVAWAWHSPSGVVWSSLSAALFANLVALVSLDGWPFFWRQTPGWKATTWAALVTSFIALTAALGVALYGEHRMRNVGLVLAVVAYAPILGYVAERRIRDVWRPMMDAEVAGDPALPGAPSPTLRNAATRAVTVAMTVGVGGFLAFVPLIYESVEDSMRFSGGWPSQGEWHLVIMPTLGGLLLGTPVIRTLFDHPRNYSRDNPPSRRRSSWSVLTLGYLALATMLASTVLLATQVGWHGTTAGMVAVLAIIMALDCLEQTVVDSAVLSMRWPRPADYAIGAAAGAVTFTTIFWSLLSGIGAGGLGLNASILVFLAGFIARMVAALVAGGLIYARGTRYSAIYFPISWCHIQNEVVRSVVVLVGAWLPVFVFTHTTLTGSAKWITVVGATSAVFFLATRIYVFSMRRLLEHSYEQRSIRFGGRFSDPTPPSGDLRDILPQAVGLVREFVQYARSRLRLRLHGPDEEGLVKALGAHLAFSFLIRTTFVCATLIGLLVGLLSELQSPAETRRRSR